MLAATKKMMLFGSLTLMIGATGSSQRRYQRYESGIDRDLRKVLSAYGRQKESALRYIKKAPYGEFESDDETRKAGFRSPELKDLYLDAIKTDEERARERQREQEEDDRYHARTLANLNKRSLRSAKDGIIRKTGAIPKSLVLFTTKSDGYTCDKCRVVKRAGAKMYGCRKADYDLCIPCYKRSRSPMERLNMRVKEQQEEQKMPQTSASFREEFARHQKDNAFMMDQMLKQLEREDKERSTAYAAKARERNTNFCCCGGKAPAMMYDTTCMGNMIFGVLRSITKRRLWPCVDCANKIQAALPEAYRNTGIWRKMWTPKVMSKFQVDDSEYCFVRDKKSMIALQKYLSKTTERGKEVAGMMNAAIQKL